MIDGEVVLVIVLFEEELAGAFPSPGDPRLWASRGTGIHAPDEAEKEKSSANTRRGADYFTEPYGEPTTYRRLQNRPVSSVRIV